MPVTHDILRAWRSPRCLIREKLAAGPREDRALATLMGAAVLIFVAQWPGLSRAAYFEPSVPLEARLSGALLATIFLLPLLSYAIAAFSHLLARLARGKGTWFGARLALFWALLAISPLMLFNGLVAGFIGAGPAATLVGVLVMAGFLYLWINMLIEAER